MKCDKMSNPQQPRGENSKLGHGTYYIPIYELFLDLPHPDHSAHNDGSKIIGPPLPWHTNSSDSSLQQELFEPDTVSKITKYAFPDHNEQLLSASMSYRSIMKSLAMGDDEGGGSSLPSLNRHDIYYSDFSEPYFHTFLLRLNCGERIHGHVRRYLPYHSGASSRYDVGRRSVRAMVLLTRSSGGVQLWSALLRTLESVTLMCIDDTPMSKVQAFLHNLYEGHRLLFDRYEEEEKCADPLDGKHQPTNNNLSSVQVYGIEFGRTRDGVPRVPNDCVSFLLPLSLQPGYSPSTVEDIDTPLLPLLRCLGTSNYMRLMSALLCERRVILISANLSRLSSCVQAASAMLAQGLLVWQHVFIPVLPPHLFKYLATPMPYLIGLLESYARDLDIIPGVGGVLCINLDKNTLWTFDVADPLLTFPDLMVAESMKNHGGWIDKAYADTSQVTSDVIKNLSSSLNAVWKSDKKISPKLRRNTAHREIALSRNSVDHHTPSRRSIGWNILRHTSTQKSSRSNAGNKSNDVGEGGADSSDGENDNSEDDTELQNASESGSKRKPIAIPMQQGNFFDNETAEESIRIALVSFYLYLYGDLGMYLTEDENGNLFMDRKKFLLLKKVGGDTENSAFFRLVAHLSRSSKFKQFVKARIQELEDEENEMASESNKFTPLFTKCQKHLLFDRIRTEGIPEMVRKVAETCPQRRLAAFSEVVRERAVAVSSKIKEFDDMAVHEMIGLSQESRDVVVTLRYVVGVIFKRIVNQKSNKWRHILFGIHMLRLLLLHGPITAVSESYEIQRFVRSILTYRINTSNKGDEYQQEIREAASLVYELMLDRAKLCIQRRQCMGMKLMNMRLQKSPSWFDYLARKIPFTAPFSLTHNLFRPNDDILMGRTKDSKLQPSHPSFQSFAAYSMSDDGSLSNHSIQNSVLSTSGHSNLYDVSSTTAQLHKPLHESSESSLSDKPDGNENDYYSESMDVYSVGWNARPKSINNDSNNSEESGASFPDEGEIPQDLVNEPATNGNKIRYNIDTADDDMYSVEAWSLASSNHISKQETSIRTRDYFKVLSSKSDFSDNTEGNVPPSSAFLAYSLQG
jgi:hypothetical protein